MITGVSTDDVTKIVIFIATAYPSVVAAIAKIMEMHTSRKRAEIVREVHEAAFSHIAGIVHQLDEPIIIPENCDMPHEIERLIVDRNYQLESAKHWRAKYEELKAQHAPATTREANSTVDDTTRRHDDIAIRSDAPFE